MPKLNLGRLQRASKNATIASTVEKKTLQPTISRFFFAKSKAETKKSAPTEQECGNTARDTTTDTKERSCLVVNSPFGKRQRPTDKEDEPHTTQRSPKQLRLDGSIQQESVHSSDSESSHVPLSANTLHKLNAFSLDSAKDSGGDLGNMPCLQSEDSAERKCRDLEQKGQTAEPVIWNRSKSWSPSPKNKTDSANSRSAKCKVGTRGSSGTGSAALGRFSSESCASLQTPDSSSTAAGEHRKGRVSRTKSQFTPLEQQFMKIKEGYQDAVLFVECGYKYRFFGQDAEIAAKELNIFCHLDHNFMTASIPTHRLFVHIRRLVAKGYKVGVVKQTETAALKAAGDNRSQPFERKLSALYTKSTLIGEDLEPSNHSGELGTEESFSYSTSYLFCLYELTKEGSKGVRSGGTEFGFVAVQPGTGDITYDRFHDNDHLCELDTRLQHINPVELLLPQSLSERTEKLLKDLRMSVGSGDCIRVERLPDDVFEYGAAFEQVSAFYGNLADSPSDNSQSGSATFLQSILKLPKPVVCCLAALLKYLKEFHLHRILQLTSNMIPFSSSTQAMKLDACALRNLEVVQNQVDRRERGTLLWVMNHTKTRFGKRLLIKWLSQPLLNTADVDARLEAVTELLASDLLQLKNVYDVLAKAPDLDRGLCSIYHKKCSVGEFVSVVRALAKLRLSAKALEGSTDLGSALLGNVLGEVPHLLEGIDSFLAAINQNAAREGNKTKLFTDPSQFPNVHQCLTSISEVTDQMGDHLLRLRAEVSMPAADYVTVSGNEYMVEVRNTMLKRVPKDWVPVSSTKQVSRFRPPYVEASFRRLSQLREQLALECQTAWLQFLDSFGEKYFSFRKAVQHLATLDCLFSLAAVSKQEGYCRPTVHSGPSSVEIKAGRHPVVSALKADGQQYVPNDTAITIEGGLRCMIITGPNMGGKSSYIKQVALITLMAQVGCYVPAESATIGVLDAIYTRMGASDDIFQNRSTFMSELQEASDILSRATPRSLVIMDELGRGTSTHDGVAIAYATAMHLIAEVRCLTLFVTHYPPLAELGKEYPTAAGNFHMSFLVQDNTEDEEITMEKLTFLYQLVEGVAARSYGLNVARLADVPDSILIQATRKSRELEDAVMEMRDTKEVFMRLWKVWPTSPSSEAPTLDLIKRIQV